MDWIDHTHTKKSKPTIFIFHEFPDEVGSCPENLENSLAAVFRVFGDHVQDDEDGLEFAVVRDGEDAARRAQNKFLPPNRDNFLTPL